MIQDLQKLLIHTLKLSSSEFAGKVVVVTGAGRGIGQQAATAFALLGANVVIAELSEEGQKVAQEICAAGGSAVYVQCDVSQSASVEKLRDVVHQTFGPADIVVNNAIRICVAPVSEMREEVWDGIIAVNLSGAFRISKTFLPDLLAKGNGILINMISTEAMPGLSAYIASKQGILGFTQSLALEVGSAGVKVIPFAPGMVDTPGIRGVSGELAPHLGMSQEQFLHISLHPDYEGFMPPEHAGAATAYLAARLADAYHGQVVNGYEVLEQAGMLSSIQQMTGNRAVPLPEGKSQSKDPRAAGQIIEQVQKILVETAKEFEKLPVFIRPIARSGFKSKSGASLEQLQTQLAALISNPSQAPADFATRLEKLIHYYQGVPAETARFTKDKDFLEEVQRISHLRITAIQALIDYFKS